MGFADISVRPAAAIAIAASIGWVILTVLPWSISGWVAALGRRSR
jgi:hypothetical protein